MQIEQGYDPKLSHPHIFWPFPRNGHEHDEIVRWCTEQFGQRGSKNGCWSVTEPFGGIFPHAVIAFAFEEDAAVFRHYWY